MAEVLDRVLQPEHLSRWQRSQAQLRAFIVGSSM
jgi:hypothetical protein